MRVPQDLANLLAVAVRDLLWYKPNVRAYFKECGVGRSILIEVERSQNATPPTPTIKLVHHVLDRLAEQGDDGEKPIRAMLTRIYYWKDLHSIEEKRRDAAVASLKAFQAAYQKYEAQVQHQQDQERKMQQERVDRKQPSALDHKKLQGFRDEFDRIHALSDRQERGNQFQDLMNRVFSHYCEKSKGAFQRTGEQIDGLFYFDNHWYYVEVRWKEEKANAADISVLRDRAKNAYGGDTKALFVSFNGFTSDCLDRLERQGDERVILMDGFDLRCALDCRIAFDVLLAEKQAELVQNGRAFVGASEIIATRKST